MWNITTSPRYADLADFVNKLEQYAFFQSDQPVIVARAPGRLDLMGGIADYSGSLVLQMPLACAALAAVQYDQERVLTVRSTASELGTSQELCLPLSTLAPQGQALDYAAAQALFQAKPEYHWAAYMLGALVVLAHECQLSLSQGLRLLIHSHVPPGKGVSSSAAVEVASMRAIAALFKVELEGQKLATLCQITENRVVAAPCGIMDQMTSACGQEGRLLALLCQPAEIQGHVRLPEDVEVWGIDSGIRHAVGGADYGDVRVAAFMGYRILADQLGMPSEIIRPGRVKITDPQWHGYLANISPSVWEAQLREHVPLRIRGDAFLERYTGFTDQITSIDEQRSYAVQVATAHPIYEHQRVLTFRALLEAANLYAKHPSDESTSAREQLYRLMGELMYQSHASYSACGLGSPGTDRLVALVRELGAAHGLYGAKITGGGSGGTVAVLARRGSTGIIAQIAQHYAQESGLEPLVLSGSSEGAMRAGIVSLLPSSKT